MTMIDARPGAFLGAMECLKTCDQYRKLAEDDVKDGGEGVLPDWYWGIVAEADVYARLATAATEVGLAAGTHMKQQQSAAERIAAAQSKAEALFDDAVKESTDA